MNMFACSKNTSASRLPSPRALLRVVGRGWGGGAMHATPPTPARIADAMLTTPPRRFAGGGEEKTP